MAKKIKTRKQRAYEIILAIWAKVSSLKVIYGVVAIIIAMALLVLFYNLYWEIYLLEWGKSATDGETKPNQTNVQNLALAFLGVTSGFAALFGGYLAILKSEENKRQSDAAESQSTAAHEQNKLTNAQNEITNEQNEIANKQNEITNEQNKIANEQNKIASRQADTAEQGLITDRLNKATEGLGKSDNNGEPIIEIRLGALYAMERIAKDSIRDHVQIMEIFCAYIRHGSLKNKANKTIRPTEDIQTALTIIGRRGDWPEGEKRIAIEKEKRYYIELSDCYLYGARLNKANLANAMFLGANLTNAWFSDSDLSNGSLTNAILTDSWFERTILNETLIDSAVTTTMNANTGDFSGFLKLTQEQLNQMFLGRGIEVPKGLKHPQEGTIYHQNYTTFSDFISAYSKWKQEKAKKEREEAKAKAEEDDDIEF